MDVGGEVSVFNDPALCFRSATQCENYIVHPDIPQVVGRNSKDQFVGAGEVDGWVGKGLTVPAWKTEFSYRPHRKLGVAGRIYEHSAEVWK